MEWSRFFSAALICFGVVRGLYAEDAGAPVRQAEILEMQARRLEQRGDWDGARHMREQVARLEQSTRQWQTQRIEHLERAARSLAEGGFEEEAQQLRERAAAMQRDLAQANGRVSEQTLVALRELRQSIDHLAGEISELRRQLQHLKSAPEPTLAPTTQQPAPSRYERSAEIPDEQLDAPSPSRMPRNVPAGETPVYPTPAKGAAASADFEFELIPLEPTPAREPTPTGLPGAESKAPVPVPTPAGDPSPAADD